MTRSIIIFCLLIGVAGFANAQATFTKPSDSDPKAKKILDLIKKEYLGYKSMDVAFELEIEMPGRPKEKQKGSYIQQGKKFFASSKDQDIYCDGKTVWMHLKANKEVQVNNYEGGESNELIMTPTEMVKLYESGKYIYAITGNDTENGAAVTLIEFKPVNRNSNYAKLRLAVNTKTNKVSSLRVFSKDGSRMNMFLKTLTPNKNFSNEIFVFNQKKYPNIRLEDLRID
jgi:outer membrane lipoprotein carrier protein